MGKTWDYPPVFKQSALYLNATVVMLKESVEYARTGDGSDFWHVQDESGFSDPYCSQTIGHRGY